jgi:hypothetical protein
MNSNKLLNESTGLNLVVQDVDRFLVYFMQYCLDIPVMRRYFTNQQFRQALDNRSLWMSVQWLIGI